LSSPPSPNCDLDLGQDFPLRIATPDAGDFKSRHPIRARHHDSMQRKQPPGALDKITFRWPLLQAGSDAFGEEFLDRRLRTVFERTTLRAGSWRLFRLRAASGRVDHS
jgi:hypothetical protein